MQSITKKDTLRAVQILTHAFQANPSVNWVVKNDHKIEKRVQELAKYSFKTTYRRGGAYISSNRNGVALCYKANLKKTNLIDYWNQLILLIKAIGFSNLPEVLKRESYLKSKRPLSGEYLYFWFLGVEPGIHDKGDAAELKQGIFDLSSRTQLPIYLETSVEKNRRVYERYGFETYHTWHITKNNINLHFMRRLPDTYNK